jgi:hypothetical protein
MNKCPSQPGIKPETSLPLPTQPLDRSAHHPVEQHGGEGDRGSGHSTPHLSHQPQAPAGADLLMGDVHCAGDHLSAGADFSLGDTSATGVHLPAASALSASILPPLNISTPIPITETITTTSDMSTQTLPTFLHTDLPLSQPKTVFLKIIKEDTIAI